MVRCFENRIVPEVQPDALKILSVHQAEKMFRKLNQENQSQSEAPRLQGGVLCKGFIDRHYVNISPKWPCAH